MFFIYYFLQIKIKLIYFTLIKIKRTEKIRKYKIFEKIKKFIHWLWKY